MEKKSLGITLLYWIEAIIAARVLLFAVPVLIHRWMNQTLASYEISDWFIVSLAIIALFYFLVGVTSIMGYRFWRYIHFLACAITLLITVALVKEVNSAAASLNMVYFVPVTLSVLTIIIILLNGKPKMAGA